MGVYNSLYFAIDLLCCRIKEQRLLFASSLLNPPPNVPFSRSTVAVVRLILTFAPGCRFLTTREAGEGIPAIGDMSDFQHRGLSITLSFFHHFVVEACASSVTGANRAHIFDSDIYSVII